MEGINVLPASAVLTCVGHFYASSKQQAAYVLSFMLLYFLYIHLLHSKLFLLTTFKLILQKIVCNYMCLCVYVNETAGAHRGRKSLDLLKL